MRIFLSFAVAFTLLLTAVSAQTSQQSEPQTIAECLKAAQQHAERQVEEARKAGQKPDYNAYFAQAKEIAKKYAARFKVQEVNEADLPTLAQLYMQADQPALAREAINRRLKSASLSESERADALVFAVGIAMNGSPSDENIKLGEDLTAQVDALSSAVIKQKISGHSRMAGYYGYADIDEPNMAHNATVLKLISQLPTEERNKYARQSAVAYDRIALVQANRGLTDKALETLRQGKAEIASVNANAAAALGRAIERYSLIGKPGAALKGTYWINAAPETKQLDLRGRVTLIQFTAHWCGPCRKSYPAMLKFHEQFNGRGLNVMMVTQLYGYFSTRQNLKPEEEMAANREYYLEHHKLPFKIAVEPQLDFSDRAAAEAAQREMNDGKYVVGGIPQIVLLDKQGVIRQILIGWDPANEARITKLIEQLLKEPAVATR